MPKQKGMIVVQNKDGELIATRPINGWRICIDYWHLNESTAKDHYPPLISQSMLRAIRQIRQVLLSRRLIRLSLGLYHTRGLREDNLHVPIRDILILMDVVWLMHYIHDFPKVHNNYLFWPDQEGHWGIHGRLQHLWEWLQKLLGKPWPSAPTLHPK